MKKIFALVLLLTINVVGYTQELNFEETVKYINDKIACCTRAARSIQAKSNGEVTVLDHGNFLFRFNFFDIEKTKGRSWGDNFKVLNEEYGMQNVVRMGKNQVASRYIEINGIEHGLAFLIDDDATATLIYKALLHLRSLCTKEKDPFDN